MPGRNCAFFGCPTSQKHKVSLFKIPSLRDDDSEHTVALKTKAREEWLRLILRTRETTPELKKRIQTSNLFLCELHFKSDCILTSPTRKILVTGSVPTENLPKKSHEIEKNERRPLVRIPLEDIPSTSASSVLDIAFIAQGDVLEQLDVESLAPWVSEKLGNGDMAFKLRDGVHSIAKYNVSVNTTLEFTVFIFHWPLPEDHSIYTYRKRSVRDMGVKELLSLIENTSLCDGLPEDHMTKSVALDPTSGITHQLPGTVIRHSVPKCSSPTHFEVSVNYRFADWLCWSLMCKVDYQRVQKLDPLI